MRIISSLRHLLGGAFSQDTTTSSQEPGVRPSPAAVVPSAATVLPDEPSSFTSEPTSLQFKLPYAQYASLLWASNLHLGRFGTKVYVKIGGSSVPLLRCERHEDDLVLEIGIPDGKKLPDLMGQRVVLHWVGTNNEHRSHAFTIQEKKG